MRRTHHLWLAAALLAGSAGAQTLTADPYRWLEDVTAPKSLDWVRAQNADSQKALATDPAFALRVPLFVLVFILVIAGVIIGGVAAWLRQHKWRRNARRLAAELRRTQDEVERLRRQLAAQ